MKRKNKKFQKFKPDLLHFSMMATKIPNTSPKFPTMKTILRENKLMTKMSDQVNSFRQSINFLYFKSNFLIPKIQKIKYYIEITKRLINQIKFLFLDVILK